MTLLLLVGGFGRASAAWMCEGRVCSPDLSRCCCASPSEARDASCLTSGEARVSSACEGECSCQAVVTKASDAPAFQNGIVALAFAAMDDVQTLPPTVLVLQAFVLLESPQVRAIPPPDALHEATCAEQASPRAPPAATA